MKDEGCGAAEADVEAHSLCERFFYPQITQITQIFKSIPAKEKTHALKELSLVYPQITQIHADFWDFFKDYFCISSMKMKR